MRERGSVTLARSGRLRVQFGDLVIVVVVDLGAHVQLHWGSVVLVLLAQELEELRVVEHLVEWLRVRVGRGEASKCSESEVRFHFNLWLNRRDFELIIIFRTSLPFKASISSYMVALVIDQFFFISLILS